MSMEELVARSVESHRAAVACGCGGSEHPEHELDDLAVDIAQSRIGSFMFLVIE